MAETLRILYVDDEPALLEIGKIFLERGGAFVVDTLTSAPEALTRLSSERYDAIISDYQMPAMDGITFLKHLKVSGNTTPFIIFTGRGREEVVIEALNEGADFYIQKGGEPKSQFTELAHQIQTAVSRQRTEKRAKDSERRLYDIINFLPDATFAIDTQGVVIAWNRAIEEMTGVPARDMIGQGDHAYTIPFYGERRRQLLDLIDLDDEEVRSKYQYVTKKGNTLYAEVFTPALYGGNGAYVWATGSPLFDDNGNRIGAIESIRDITERKVIEEGLQETNEYLNNLFDYANAPIIVWDPRFFITRFNHAFENLTLISEQEVIGQRLDILFPKESREASLLQIKKTLEGEHWETVEIPILTKEGNVRTILWNSANILDPESRLISTIAQGVDITGRIHAEEALRESETRYRNVVEDQTEFICRFLPDGTHIFVNNAYCRYFNKERGDIIGRKCIPEIPKEDLLRVREHFALLTKENPTAIITHRIILPGGKVQWQRWSDRALFDEQGTVIEYQSVGRDVTEMKQMEKALQESESVFRQLEEQLPDYVLIHDGEIIIFVNAEGARLMGKTPDEIIGTSVLSYVVPQYHDLIRKNIGLRHRGIPVEPYEIVIYSPSGEHRWVMVRATLIPNQNKPMMLTVLTDFTSKKHAEEALRESEAKYRAIIENMQDLFYRTDVQGNVTMASPRGARLAAWASPDQLIGRNVTLDVYADPKEREQFLAVLAESGEVSDYPLSLKAGDGTIRYTTASSHFYYDEDGKVLGVEGILHDVTERKRAEEALLQANRKLNLLSDITRHDINNQLTALIAYLAILEEKQPDPVLNGYLRNAATAAERISSLIGFTREYEQIGVNAPAWQDIRTLVTTAEKEASPGNITLKNDLPAGIEVFADPLITRVFYNLMDNAVRYGGKITTIRFSVEDRNGDLIIVCEDDGEGVPAHEKERIFDRGFGKNTGLGLPLSREILDITGITITETGEPGKGARFEMTVPIGAYRFQKSP